MRILVTGSRNYQKAHLIRDMLSFYVKRAKRPNLVTLVVGDAKGADSLANDIATMMGCHVEVYPADWNQYGRGAGPIRNQEMVDDGADVCLAFLTPESKGTLDCMKRAHAAGIPVIEPKPEKEKQEE